MPLTWVNLMQDSLQDSHIKCVSSVRVLSSILVVAVLTHDFFAAIGLTVMLLVHCTVNINLIV